MFGKRKKLKHKREANENAKRGKKERKKVERERMWTHSP